MRRGAGGPLQRLLHGEVDVSGAKNFYGFAEATDVEKVAFKPRIDGGEPSAVFGDTVSDQKAGNFWSG